MGQKVNPFIFRAILNRNWESSWYVKKKLFSSYLIEDLNIRNYLKIYFSNIILSKIIIQKNSVNVNISVYIKNRNDIVNNKKFNLLFLENYFSIYFKKNFFISIKNISNPSINLVLIFHKIKKKIEQRSSFKNTLKNIIYDVFKNKAFGFRIIIQGRINGSIMTKRQIFKQGRMPLNRMCANIRYYSNYVVTNFGSIGIKIWIYLGDYIYY